MAGWGYVAAKQRVFAQQSGKTAASVWDDEPSRALYTLAEWRWVTGASFRSPVRIQLRGGVYGLEGELFRWHGRSRRRSSICAPYGRSPANITGRMRRPSMPPAGRWVCSATKIATGLRLLPGPRDRQELIAVMDGVPWINDSKATNADAAAKALACYGSILWIAGGQPKEGGIASLEPYFPRIRHVFLIGEASRLRGNLVRKGAHNAFRRSRYGSYSSAGPGARAIGIRGWSCCRRRPAPLSINSRISSTAASGFGSSSKLLLKARGIMPIRPRGGWRRDRLLAHGYQPARAVVVDG